MEKKKLKLSISGNSKKTLSNIEQARYKSKNSVIIEKKGPRLGRKQVFHKTSSQNQIKPINRFNDKKLSTNNLDVGKSDYEKRKLAEQRATKRLREEAFVKDAKGKPTQKKRELKLTLSRALSDEDLGSRSRSIASLRRAKIRENREQKQQISRDELKPIKRDINIPKTITIRELANRMAEQSGNIIII